MEDNILYDWLKLALAFGLLVGVFLAVRRRIVGLEGVVVEGPGPNALIMVNGQKWRAVAADGTHLQPGDVVVVLKVRGLQLAVVSRKSSAGAPEQAR